MIIIMHITAQTHNNVIILSDESSYHSPYCISSQLYVLGPSKSIQSNRTRPILQHFVFSPEVTCNRRNDASAKMSVPENTIFSTTQNVFGIGLVVPEG